MVRAAENPSMPERAKRMTQLLALYSVQILMLEERAAHAGISGFVSSPSRISSSSAPSLISTEHS